MPIYEYHCPKCDNVFEEWQRHIEDAVTHPCPKCGGEAERMVSNTSFMLKGGGWYATDYGTRKNDPVEQSSSSSGAAASS